MKKINNFPINILPKDKYKFKLNPIRNIKSKDIIFLTNVYIFPDGIIVKDNEIIDYNFPFPYDFFKKFYNTSIYYDRLKFYVNNLKIKKIKYPFLIITDVWSGNYFHWFSEALVRLINIYDNIREVNPKILLPSYFKNISYIESSLQKLSLLSFEFQNENFIYYVERLYIAPHIISSGYHDSELMKKLRDKLRFNTEISDKHNLRLYISRRNSKVRRIINEREIEEILKENDFKIVEMENIHWTQQVEIMSKCEILVAPHGAGLTNMLFGKDNLIVFELLPQRDNKTINCCYFSLANSLGYKYFYQFASTQIKSSPNDDGGDSHLIIDTVRFSKNLKKILAKYLLGDIT